jgi:hypothetical protein
MAEQYCLLHTSGLPHTRFARKWEPYLHCFVLGAKFLPSLVQQGLLESHWNEGSAACHEVGK